MLQLKPFQEKGRAFLSNFGLADIKNHLGHDNIQSTTICLHLDLTSRREIQKELIKHMESLLISAIRK